MQTIHVYIGPPGSGKTYLASSHQQQLGGFLIDDILDAKDLYSAIDAGNDNVFITDPHLCLEREYFSFKKLMNLVYGKNNSVNIKYYFFENNVDKCWANITHRDDGRVIPYESVLCLCERYHIPEGVNVIPVWNSLTN